MCCIQLKVWPLLWFLAYFCQNLVAMVTPLWPESTEVSQMNSMIAQTLYVKTKLCMNWRIQLRLWPFCDILPILAKNWLPWQHPLDPPPAIRSVFIGLVDDENAVISNHILVIYRGNAFICIYSNLVPKLVAMVTPLCPLCTGVSEMNSLIAQTLSQNQTLHRYVAYN